MMSTFFCSCADLYICTQLKRCQQMVEQLQMDKETLKQQCHDLQQEFLLEGDKQQELQEQIKRLKDEIKNRLVCILK